jgi:hypothetical protein
MSRLEEIKNEWAIELHFDSWENDCGYCDLRNEDYQQRKTEGYEALEIAKDIRNILDKIKKFNSKNKRKY